jgi:hypothetical protein
VSIAKVIPWAGGYDSTIELKLLPCNEADGCTQDEGLRQQRPIPQ